MLLLKSLLSASEEIISEFLSPRHCSSGSYALHLSGFADPTDNNATAGLTLRVSRTHKPLYHGKLEVLLGFLLCTVLYLVC
jgi:hypothetical protein